MEHRFLRSLWHLDGDRASHWTLRMEFRSSCPKGLVRFRKPSFAAEGISRAPYRGIVLGQPTKHPALRGSWRHEVPEEPMHLAEEVKHVC